MAKVYDGKLSTVTLSCMRLATAMICGAKVKYPQKSTINEHLTHLVDRIPDESIYPRLQYLIVGNRGHEGVTESDGFSDVVPIGKRANASGMFKAIPLVLRAMDNDLTDTQRANYAFRIKRNFNNRDYWAYYLKRIDMRSVETKDYIITRKNQKDDVKEFNYTDAELFPKPEQLPDYDYDDDNKVSIPDGKYVTANADIVIKFDDFDVQEYMNVTAIMRGNSRSSVISELALCSGVDFPHTGDSATGSPFPYQEAIGVQALYHISLYNNLAITNDNLNITVKVGQSAPFFVSSL